MMHVNPLYNNDKKIKEAIKLLRDEGIIIPIGTDFSVAWTLRFPPEMIPQTITISEYFDLIKDSKTSPTQ